MYIVRARACTVSVSRTITCKQSCRDLYGVRQNSKESNEQTLGNMWETLLIEHFLLRHFALTFSLSSPAALANYILTTDVLAISPRTNRPKSTRGSKEAASGFPSAASFVCRARSADVSFFDARAFTTSWVRVRHLPCEFAVIAFFLRRRRRR